MTLCSQYLKCLELLETKGSARWPKNRNPLGIIMEVLRV